MDIINELLEYKVETENASWHPNICDRAAKQIIKLLHCIEVAENRCNLAERCFDDSALYFCETQLEIEKKTRSEAESRAEKAEKERDEALDLIGRIYYEACVSVEHDMRQHLDWLKDKIEEWKKNKEE